MQKVKKQINWKDSVLLNGERMLQLALSADENKPALQTVTAELFLLWLCLPEQVTLAKAAPQLSTDFNFLFGHRMKKCNVFSRAVPLLTVTLKSDKTLT